MFNTTGFNITDCLYGCIGEFASCSPPNDPLAKGADYTYATMAPFVKAWFGVKEHEYITVGNKSYPNREHEAIIAGFEYGVSNGIDVNLEIIDEEGGAFNKFFEEIKRYAALDTTEAEVNPYIYLRMRFGWMGTGCDNIRQPVIVSPEIRALLIKVDATAAEGKFKFNVTAKDIAHVLTLSRGKEAFGGDKTKANKLSLKSALRQLFSPKFDVNGACIEPGCRVDFLKVSTNGGSPDKFLFKDGGVDSNGEVGNGPENFWPQLNQDKIATAYEWLSSYRTKDDKGIVITAYESPGGELIGGYKGDIIFWEDINDNCTPATQSCLPNHTGLTFIVNAGKCSPVLEFSPKVNWALNFNALPGVGGITAPVSHESIASDGKQGTDANPCQTQTKRAGVTVVPTLTSQGIDTFGSNRALREAMKGQTAQIQAHAAFGFEAIRGDLKIVGDPREIFCNVNPFGRPCSIVVINPLHLVRTEDDSCPDWLTDPMCNNYMSNKNWIITKQNHSITADGKYVTTLSVTLPPGVYGPKSNPPPPPQGNPISYLSPDSFGGELPAVV